MTSMRRPLPQGHTDPVVGGRAGGEETVLGVDTHKDTHVAAVITVVGVLLGTRAFPATGAGYRRLLAWARSFGVLRRAGVEGTGCYGAALTRYLRGQGVAVAEVNRADRATRRRRGKSDPVDAEAAARAVLAGRSVVIPKTGDGPAEILPVFTLARDSAVTARTQAINQLEGRARLRRPGSAGAAVRAGPGQPDPGLRAAARPRLRPGRHRRGGPHPAAAGPPHRPALRRGPQPAPADDPSDRRARPAAARAGRGRPDNADPLLIAAGDNPDRLTPDASFAALCGVSPVQASSGKTRRRRLNRGGNRQANSALHRIALTRLRHDPRTRAYLDRRTAEGKTRREAIRCLKRYLAREIYTLLQPPTTAPTHPTAA
jgi:transposase